MLQLAVHNAVFLLDPLALPQRVSQDKLVEFIDAIFGSKNILKLGKWCQLFTAPVIVGASFWLSRLPSGGRYSNVEKDLVICQ